MLAPALAAHNVGIAGIISRKREYSRVRDARATSLLVGLFLLLIIMQGLANLLFPRTCADPKRFLDR